MEIRPMDLDKEDPRPSCDDVQSTFFANRALIIAANRDEYYLRPAKNIQMAMMIRKGKSQPNMSVNQLLSEKPL